MVAFAVAAQPPPVRILRGELIEWQVRGPVGDFALRGDDHKVERCRVQPETHIARQTLRISAAGVRVGDSLEVVADARDGPCIALTIYIRPPEQRRPLTYSSPVVMSLATTALPHLWPIGSIGFAGVVSRVDKDRLTIQTRDRAMRSFTVLDDTIFSDTGRLVESNTLVTYTRVWVRATRSYRGDLEAHHVAWGAILTPNR